MARSEISGGMAIVFSAYDRANGETVAIKLLNEKLCDGSQSLSDLKKQFVLSFPFILPRKGKNPGTKRKSSGNLFMRIVQATSDDAACTD